MNSGPFDLEAPALPSHNLKQSKVEEVVEVVVEAGRIGNCRRSNRWSNMVNCRRFNLPSVGSEARLALFI